MRKVCTCPPRLPPTASGTTLQVGETACVKLRTRGIHGTHNYVGALQLPADRN